MVRGRMNILNRVVKLQKEQFFYFFVYRYHYQLAKPINSTQRWFRKYVIVDRSPFAHLIKRLSFDFEYLQQLQYRLNIATIHIRR